MNKGSWKKNLVHNCVWNEYHIPNGKGFSMWMTCLYRIQHEYIILMDFISIAIFHYTICKVSNIDGNKDKWGPGDVAQW